MSLNIRDWQFRQKQAFIIQTDKNLDSLDYFAVKPNNATVNVASTNYKNTLVLGGYLKNPEGTEAWLSFQGKVPRTFHSSGKGFNRITALKIQENSILAAGQSGFNQTNLWLRDVSLNGQASVTNISPKSEPVYSTFSTYENTIFSNYDKDRNKLAAFNFNGNIRWETLLPVEKIYSNSNSILAEDETSILSAGLCEKNEKPTCIIAINKNTGIQSPVIKLNY